MNDIKLVASGFCKETEHSNLLLDYLVDTSKNRINTSFLRPLASVDFALEDLDVKS